MWVQLFVFFWTKGSLRAEQWIVDIENLLKETRIMKKI